MTKFFSGIKKIRPGTDKKQVRPPEHPHLKPSSTPDSYSGDPDAGTLTL